MKVARGTKLTGTVTKAVTYTDAQVARAMLMVTTDDVNSAEAEFRAHVARIADLEAEVAQLRGALGGLQHKVVWFVGPLCGRWAATGLTVGAWRLVVEDFHHHPTCLHAWAVIALLRSSPGWGISASVGRPG